MTQSSIPAGAGEDLDGAFEAISRESQALLDALERDASAQLTAALDAARKSGGRDIGCLMALLKRAKQAMLSVARRATRDEANGRRAALHQQRKGWTSKP